MVVGRTLKLLEFFFYFFSKKYCHLLSTLTFRKLLTNVSSGSCLKEDNPLLPLPHSHLPRKYRSLLALTPDIRESVVVEPQLTHLETSICGGHLTLLTYFFATSSCYPNLPLLKLWSYFLMKNEQQREFSLSVMKAFGVSGIHFQCVVRKKWDASWVSLPY